MIFILYFIIILFSCTKPTILIPKSYEQKVLQSQTEYIKEGELGCPYGGVHLTTWIDQNRIDGIYTKDIDSDFKETINCFVLGSSMTQGFKATLITTPESNGTHCPTSGNKIESFTDINNNGTYESDIDKYYSVKYVCNGSHSITLNTTLPVGDTMCPAGGTEFFSFTDINNNGTYEVDIDTNNFKYKVCNTQKALILPMTINTGDTTCPSGGTLIISCIDNNNDNSCNSSLDINYSSQKICNGLGSSFVISNESSGINCKAGGYRLDKFQDVNNNGTYDSGLDLNYTSSYICHGLNWISLKTSFTAGNGTVTDNSSCPAGGIRFEFGYDHVNSSDGSYHLGTDGVLDTSEIVSASTAYSCNGSQGDGGPLIANFQNDSEGINARFYWEIISADGSVPNVKLGYSSTKAAIQAWNCENTLAGVTVVTNFSSCTDTTYRTSNTGNLTANAMCGFNLSSAPFSLNPWDYRYFKLCAQNATSPNSQSITSFRVAGSVPSGMVMVHLDEWPINEFANTSVVPFTYAIDKWEAYYSSGGSANGTPGVCTSTNCIASGAGVLDSASGQYPNAGSDWYSNRAGCANRIAAGYTGASTPRMIHLQTEMENFVANYGTPDNYLEAFGNQVTGNMRYYVSAGYLGCNSDMKHNYTDISWNNDESYQTGDIGTKNCISRYGARDLNGNYGEIIDGYYENLDNNTTRQKSVYWGTPDKVTKVISDAILGYAFPTNSEGYFVTSWDYENLLPSNSIIDGSLGPSSKFFHDLFNLDTASTTRIVCKDQTSWTGGSRSGRFSKSIRFNPTNAYSDIGSRCAIVSP